MRSKNMRKQLDNLLSSLDQAEHYGDTDATQKAYEDLFTLCQKSDLDLDAAIHQPRTHSWSSGIVAG